MPGILDAPFREGIDFVILGHFHQERLDRFSREASTKVVAVLPSWKDRWRYFYLGGTAPRLPGVPPAFRWP